MEQSSTSESTEILDLIERIASQEVKALELLYENMSDTLMGVIYNVLKNQAEAEDTLQETFIAIWNKASQYKPALGKPKSWLVTVARNKALDKYRSLSRKAEGNQAFQTHQKLNPTPDTPNTDNEHLQLAMQKLNADQKEAIELVFFKGLTQQEAAQQLETPLGTIKARIRRGLQFLKQTLNTNSSHG